MSGRLNVDGRVSVVLAVYKGQKYVANAITSILRQTYDDVELVIVMDSHDDEESLAVVKETLYSYDVPARVYYTNGPNHFTPMGGLWPYIIGAGNSTGEFLSFHSQDDMSMEPRFERLTAAIGDKSLAYSKVMHVNAAGDGIRSTGIDVNEQYNTILNDDTYFVPHLLFSSTMFRKDIFFSRVCYPIGQYNYEKLITMKMFDAKGFAFVDEDLYIYREHDEQCSRLGSKWPEIVKLCGYDPKEIWNGRFNYGNISNKDLREETLSRI